MRRAAEDQVWTRLKASCAGQPARPFPVGDGSTLDLAAPCIVVGGRNGAGKSRLLRQLSASLDGAGLLLDLHHLCEQALMVLRSREDFNDMVEEYEDLGPTAERLDDLRRVVGRDYDLVEWFALEVEPSDQSVAERFRWSGDQPLVPYFRVEYRGLHYTSRDMGLGEFSVHFLFWILEHYREAADLTLLLDEPDAFLPPVGVSALLTRVLQLCLKRGWRVVLTTHSEEMIVRALEADAFTLLRIDERGATVALNAADDPSVGSMLLARPPIEHIIFCEDESAWYLTRALLDSVDRQLLRATSVIWGRGSGYLAKLHEHLPRQPRPDIRFAFAFDGDQRGNVEVLEGRWPAVFLPTNEDPDTLFKRLAADPEGIGARLGRPTDEVARCLDMIEGADPHDWVNDLAGEFGRAQVLTGLASLWAAKNQERASAFLDELVAGWT